jgi:hypothetical protein
VRGPASDTSNLHCLDRFLVGLSNAKYSRVRRASADYSIIAVRFGCNELSKSRLHRPDLARKDEDKAAVLGCHETIGDSEF